MRQEHYVERGQHMKFFPKSKAFKAGRACLFDMAHHGCFEGRAWSFEEGLKLNPFRQRTRKHNQWQRGLRKACQEMYRYSMGND